MSVRKQIVQEATNVPTEIILDDNTQELESVDDRDEKDELSSSLLSPPSARNSRRRERENQSQPKEMTEEEMMDLALRLSEQEASNTALQLQREEEAMMKAIEESMVGQTQPGPPSQSQSLLAHASLRLCSRRKLLCSNGMRTPSIDQEASKDVCTPETDLTQETKGAGEEIKNRNKKRKRKEGLPLETSEVSQKIESQASPGSSEPLDSPQISDSAQIHDSPLPKSPVFLSTDCRALVQVPRLSQDLLETCRSSGFVLCSQETCASPQKSLPALPRSPTFPRSPGNLSSGPKSPVSLQEDDEDTQLTQSLEYLRSPVFGRNTRCETTPRAGKPLVSVCDHSGLELSSSSQESLTSSVRTTSCRPQSPVFPSSPAPPPAPPPERSPICSPVFSETHRGAAEPSPGPPSSPVFGRSGREVSDDGPRTSVVPSEVERSNREVSRVVGEESSQRPSQPCSTDPHPDDVRLNMVTLSEDSQELVETPEDLNAAETELTSDMTLVWSDKDEDVTPAGSPSPVFPGEGGAGRAEVQVSSLNHDSAASPGAEQRSSAAERRLQPVSSEGACAPPAVGPTVLYHWGVPFCPRGLDPDAYTQVILAQMDVYDRSLKQAQRRLLRKAPWGDAILPQPEKSPSPESSAESPPRLVSRRRGLRLRKKNQDEESPPAEEEEEEGGELRDGEEEEEAAKQKSEGGEEGQMDTDDCDVCPETQLSNNDDDETQDLMIDSGPGAELRPESPDLPEVRVIPREDPPAVVVPPPPEDKEEMEVDAAVCGTKEGNLPVGSGDAGRPHKKGEEQKEAGVDPDVEDMKVSGLQRPTSPEAEPGPAPPPSPEASVDCPICQGSFPVRKIEWHAAYCDGEVAVLQEREPGVSSRPRRKRRRAEVPGAEETNDSISSSRNQEKCFICQKKFPLREYTRHTELCLQRRVSKSQTRGNLLSALEQTETRGSEAGPSGARIQPEEVIDLRDDDDEDEEEDGVRALSISSSPIRSFTPISEATGCLIDFRRQQRAKKPSHRRR